MKNEPIVATVVYLTRNRAGITHFCLAQKKQNIHKDNGEVLANSQKWNGYGGKVEKSDTSISQCALRELYDESGVKADEADLCNVGQLQFFWPNSTTQVCDMDVTFFLLGKYEGEPHETREMGPPKYFTLDDAPFEHMMPADKLILSVIMTNRNIEGKIFFKKNAASETMIKMTTTAINDRLEPRNAHHERFFFCLRF